jgi:hypothetical protein
LLVVNDGDRAPPRPGRGSRSGVHRSVSINVMEIAIIYLEKLRDYALSTSDLVREA